MTSQRFYAAIVALAVAASACNATNNNNGGTGGTGTGGSGGDTMGAGGSAGAGGNAGAGGSTTAAVDTDIVVARLNADGSLDTTFGTDGVARLDLSTAIGNTRDSLWGAAADASDKIVLFGSKRGDGDRIDSDRVVVRLNADGSLDNTFATNGVHTLNIANLNDQPRHGVVQADGKIVASGYTSQPTGVGTQSANKVVLLRLNADGTPDNTFGVKGVVNSAPFVPVSPLTTEWGMAEAYAAVPQITAGIVTGYVTTGYGRSAPSGQVDLVSFRYSAAGVFDTSWSVATSGLFALDVNGENDRGRNLAVLDDNRAAMVGSTATSSSQIDALIAITTVDGALDTSYDTDGIKAFDFGRSDEAFYGVAKNGTTIAAAGYAAGGTGMNDDAVLAIIPFGGGTEFAQTVALSSTANDRFWSVAYDANGKIVAAGFIDEGGDTQMVVARYNADGTVDTSFGTNGVAKINAAVTAGTAETARSVMILSDGKIAVAGVAEHL